MKSAVLGWYLLASAVLVADLFTKYLAVTHLTYASPVAITQWFDFTLLYNRGAAFSFLSQAGGWQRWGLSVVAALVSVALVIWLHRLPASAWDRGVALAMILGGALGNLWDRLTLGYVVDFIHLHYREYYWPAFNLADAAITSGAVLLVTLSLFEPKRDGTEARRHRNGTQL